MQHEITIIGAGIGGLTLAKSLEQKGIPFQLLFAYINNFNPDFMTKRMSWIVDHDVTVES